MDWSPHYPMFTMKNADEVATIPNQRLENKVPKLDRQVEIADIGCGYGGLLFALAPKIPETLILGNPASVSLGLASK